MKPAYLIHGTDQAKIDQARSRLRARAEAEAGAASLQVFDPLENKGSPDADALVDSILSMSLIPGRRYLLADHVNKWGKKQVERVCEALDTMPADVTVVLFSRGEKVPPGLAEVVGRAGGEVHSYEAPPADRLPAHLVENAAKRGFELSPDAARMLIAHLGDSLARLDNELDRLALWAGPEGRVDAEDVLEMVADSSRVGDFALADALVSGDRDLSLRLAERMMAAGESAGSTVYRAATSLRRAQKALALLDSGAPPAQVQSSLGLPQFVARGVMAAVHDTSLETVRDATVAVADLEVWTRGGAEYPDDLALDLALIAATDEDA
jgi:DNA polymerase-3 subunit delta